MTYLNFKVQNDNFTQIKDNSNNSLKKFNSTNIFERT